MMLASIHNTGDLGIIGWLVALLIVLGAAYCVYLGRIVEGVVLLVVAVIAAVLLA